MRFEGCLEGKGKEGMKSFKKKQKQGKKAPEKREDHLPSAVAGEQHRHTIPSRGLLRASPSPFSLPQNKRLWRVCEKKQKQT